jgi:hypothetical protein
LREPLGVGAGAVMAWLLASQEPPWKKKIVN